MCLVAIFMMCFFFFFSSRRRHTRYWRDWSSDVCSSDLSGSRDISSDFVAERYSKPERLVRLPLRTGEVGHGRTARSEERRVGKEGRSRWSPDHLKKKNTHIRVDEAHPRINCTYNMNTYY